MEYLLRYVTDPETGKKYALPAGGSDNVPPPATGQQETTEEVTEETPPPSDTQEQEVEEEEEVDYSIAQQFLDGIEDPEVLKQLTPYVKKWDAGVTRRFQELHSQYAPYKELGQQFDPDTLNYAVQLYQIMSQDPERVYNALAQSLNKVQKEQETPSAQQEQQQAEQTGQLPPAVQERIDKLEAVANYLAEQYQQGQQKTQQQQEDEALEEYLNNLKTEFGDFDEEYVLSKMLSGKSGEEAVKAYQQLVGTVAKKTTPNAPPVLSGGGSVAQQPIEPGKLSSKDTVSLVADLMRQAAQEST